jgi:hypothetical protein
MRDPNRRSRFKTTASVGASPEWSLMNVSGSSSSIQASIRNLRH